MMQDTKRVKNPGKQRKKLFNAPAHLRHRLMSSPLSSELAASRGAKTLPVRKGDTVRIKRGDNKGFEGKVSRVDTRLFRIYIEGFTREKVDGTNIFLPIHPSKVEIRNLNLDDKWRKDILSRKKGVEKPAAKVKPKPSKKAEKIPEQPQLEIEEEKPVEAPAEEPSLEAPPIQEKAAPGIAIEEAPVEQVPEEEIAEETVEKAPAAKKAPAKKPAAKKSAPAKKKPAEEKAPIVEEKAPAKKEAAKPKAATKKAAASKTPVKEAAPKKAAAKPRVKRKTSKETEGGQ